MVLGSMDKDIKVYETVKEQNVYCPKCGKLIRIGTGIKTTLIKKAYFFCPVCHYEEEIE